MDSDGTFGLFMVVIIFCILGGAIGFTIGRDVYQNQAIKHNCAQYHSQTGEFIWKEATNVCVE